MPAPTLNDIQKQIDSVIDDAKVQLERAKNEERAIRLRISQLNRQTEIAQDSHRLAVQGAADAESTLQATEAQTASEIAEAQKTLSTLVSDIEPAQRRHDNLKAEIESAESVIKTIAAQRNALQDEIAQLTAERDAIDTEIAEARKSKDATLNNLNEAITQRSGELQAFDVKQETMRNEHKQQIDTLSAHEKALQASIMSLRKQELELINSNSILQQQVSEREAEVQEAMANLKRRENELEARERAVKNKERSVATQLRRNLT